MSETQTEEEEETISSITLGTKSIAIIIALVLIVSSIAFFGAYTARSNVQKANRQLEEQKASTGAKIDTILKNIENNKKKWTEQDKIAKEAYIIANKAEITQQAINDNTEKQKAELEKLNISLIK